MSTLAEAGARLAEHEPVLVGEEGDETIFLACAAEGIDAARLEQLHDLGHGMIMLGLTEPVARQLALPEPWRAPRPEHEVGLTAPIDAAAGIENGWSPRDRALTMRVACDPNSRPSDLRIPGHVYPAVVGERPSSAPAAAIELARLSGRAPAAALCPVVDRHGRPAAFSDIHASDRLRRLQIVSPAELHSDWIARHAGELAITCGLPTREGMFRATAYGPAEGDPATVALVHGDPATRRAPLVHIHVACLFGDAFSSLLCNCRRELERAESAIARAGAGVVIYSKPEQPVPVTCAREERIDPVIVAGLLRAVGVQELRLLDGSQTVRLRDALRACGLEVK